MDDGDRMTKSEGTNHESPGVAGFWSKSYDVKLFAWPGFDPLVRNPWSRSIVK